MIDRTTKLRWRRRVRRSKKQVGNIGQQADTHLEKHVIRRLGRLWSVRRFLLTWLVFLGLAIALLIGQNRGLSQYYQTSQPVGGGTYTEGIMGAFTNANPLYASGAVDSSVARLVFASLFKYDQNGELVGELAEEWEANTRGNEYTVTLRDNIYWHDGEPVTVDDVVFTYTTIQNPDAKSPLENSWKDVVVTAPDERTVVFELPQSLTSFPLSLTNGIVPEHILGDIEPSQLRSVSFNTINPVGAGPFKWDKLEVVGSDVEDHEERIRLVANDGYVNGEPQLSQFVIRSFRFEETMVESFERRELTAMSGLNTVPEELSEGSRQPTSYSFPLNSATKVFFNNSHELLGSTTIRRALVMAVSNKDVVNNLGYPAQLVDGPLLRSHVGYDSNLTQPAYDPEAAKKLLDDAGWKLGEDNIRTKDGKPLQFQLVTENSTEYALVTEVLQKQWQELGVDVDFLLQPIEDLQPAIAFHNYDALLYGISLGSDPDVFAYWHSSQADVRAANRLNFSEYKSSKADQALEAGRTRDEDRLRSLKYEPFLEAWSEDVPALGLYQPRYLYITQNRVSGLTEHRINSRVNRFANIENWMIRQELVDIEDQQELYKD